MGADLQEELSEIKALEESEKIADKVCKKLMSMQKIPVFLPVRCRLLMQQKSTEETRTG